MRLRVIIAALAFSGTAHATTIKTFTRAELEERAATCTAIVRGHFVRWERAAASTEGRKGGGAISVPALYGEPVLARVRVDDVITGDATLRGREIVVIDGSGSAIADIAARDAVFFLRPDGDRFWPVHFSVFSAHGAAVDIATTSAMTTPIAELRTLPVRTGYITWTADVATAAQVGGTLHVTFTAKNEGSARADALAPSHCDSVKAYPLASDGLWHGDSKHWFALPRDWFATLAEPSTSLDPRATHVFGYDVPLESLSMATSGAFDVVLGMTEGFCFGAPPARPSYMDSRVVRVTVAGSPAPPPPPPPSASVEPAPAVTPGPRSGCGACTVAPQNATPGWAAVIAFLLLARRRR